MRQSELSQRSSQHLDAIAIPHITFHLFHMGQDNSASVHTRVLPMCKLMPCTCSGSHHANVIEECAQMFSWFQQPGINGSPYSPPSAWVTTLLSFFLKPAVCGRVVRARVAPMGGWHWHVACVPIFPTLPLSTRGHEHEFRPH